MANKNFKLDRIAQNLMTAINDIINEEIDDLNFVSVTDVEITKDLVDAKVYVQTLDSKNEAYVVETLQSKSGFIKKRLSQEVEIRKVPNLIFKYDHSLDNYNRIDELLNK